MALTTELTAFFRSKLGTDADLADVEARYVRLSSDRFATVLEYLSEQRATLASRPLKFTVPDYTEDRSANISALDKAISAAQDDATAGADVPETGAVVQTFVPARRVR